MNTPKCYTWLESYGSPPYDGKKKKLFFSPCEASDFWWRSRTDFLHDLRLRLTLFPHKFTHFWQMTNKRYGMTGTDTGFTKTPPSRKAGSRVKTNKKSNRYADCCFLAWGGLRPAPGRLFSLSRPHLWLLHSLARCCNIRRFGQVKKLVGCTTECCGSSDIWSKITAAAVDEKKPTNTLWQIMLGRFCTVSHLTSRINLG